MSVGRYKQDAVIVLTIGVVVISVMAVLGAAYYPGYLGPEQPISFSHRVHAGDKEIGCLMCHPNALTAPVAGMPPMETCMLCHSRIAIHYPEIERVREHYDQGTPIWWVRVSDLPDYVNFTHDQHMIAGIDCGRCHGNVKAMDRIVLHHKFTMGFCIECHREHDATHDCFVCHH